MNILILEDNAHVSDRLKNLIEKNVNNAEVFLCSNVEEAWIKINKYIIDLFLLDIILDEKFMHKMCHSIRIGERKMKKFKEDYKRWRV